MSRRLEPLGGVHRLGAAGETATNTRLSSLSGKEAHAGMASGSIQHMAALFHTYIYMIAAGAVATGMGPWPSPTPGAPGTDTSTTGTLFVFLERRLNLTRLEEMRNLTRPRKTSC